MHVSGQIDEVRLLRSHQDIILEAKSGVLATPSCSMTDSCPKVQRKGEANTTNTVCETKEVVQHGDGTDMDIDDEGCRQSLMHV